MFAKMKGSGPDIHVHYIRYSNTVWTENALYSHKKYEECSNVLNFYEINQF